MMQLGKRAILAFGLMFAANVVSADQADVSVFSNDFDRPVLLAQASPPSPGSPRGAAPAKTPARGSRRVTAPKIAPSGRKRAELAWFWTLVSPYLNDKSPDRLAVIEAAVSSPPEGADRPPFPSVPHIKDIIANYGDAIAANTKDGKVNAALVVAVISVESAGNPNAVSRAGAQGLMQLMPPTAERFGVTNSFNPTQNITAGVTYLNLLMEMFGDDARFALAGYNAGENAVTRNEGVPPFPETRDYVPKVFAAWMVAKAFCKTPPKVVSDPCLFPSN